MNRTGRILAVALASSLSLATLAIAAPQIRLTSDAGTSQRPKVALDPQNNLVVVWEDDRFGNFEILWQKFSPLGVALTPVVRLTNTAAASRLPDIACDSDGISHVCWQEGESVNGVGTVFFCRLDANGNRTLTDRTVKDFSGHCAIATPGPGLTDLFFHRFAVIDQDVYYHRYNAAGTRTCERVFDIGTVPAIQKFPAMAVSPGGSPQLFWIDMNTSFAIHLRQGAATASCASGQALAFNNPNSNTPATAIGGPGVFTLFTVGADIYFFLGAPNACKLSQGAGTSSQPSVSADANRGYGVWRDTRDGNPEIYFCTFTDCPSQSGDVRLTNSAGNSDQPDIVVEPAGSGNWSAVWSDDRDGNREIYLSSAAASATPLPPGPPSAQLTCPPGAALTWTDVSSDETGFEVQQRANGGPWSTVATPGANATGTDITGLAYDVSYDFQVRSCKGGNCSAWIGPATVAVPAQQAQVTGTVRATLIERPDESAPSLRGLKGVRVRLMRGETIVSETLSSTTDGSYTLSGPAQCDDHVVVSLENDVLEVSSDPPPDQCPVSAPASRTEPVGYSGAVDCTWPVTGNGVSGDGTEAALSAERFAREYWEGRLGVALHRWSVRVHAPDAVKLGGGVSSWYTVIAGEFREVRGCSGFALRYPEVRDAVYHEFGHRVVAEALDEFAGLGSADADTKRWTYPEAAGLDEGLADYFTASFTDDPIIHHWGLLGGVGTLRNIHPFFPALYPTCADNLAKDSYYGGRIIAGALWDVREDLKGEPGVGTDGVDRAIHAALVQLKPLDPQQRTFIAFRDKLLATALGVRFDTRIQTAFSAHNIKPNPVSECKTVPRLKQIVHSAVGGVQHNVASWTSVPRTHHFRLYMQGVPNSDLGLASGVLVADDLTDSTYTHDYPDTTVRLSYMVTAVDSDGVEGPMGDELPAVLGVGGSAPRLPGPGLIVQPNPARGTLRFVLAGSSQVTRLQVLDVSGRHVREWRLDKASTLERTVTWDIRGSNGLKVPAGIYLARAHGPAGITSAKFVILE